MNRYECTLTPELLKKATAELNEPEDNDKRLAEIDQLRNRFQEEQDELSLLRTDDHFILRFLRAKKFNHDKAYNMLVNYHKQRKTLREVFDKVDKPELLADVMEHGPVVGIDGIAEDGSVVVIGIPGIGMPEDARMTDFLALIVLSLEYLLNDEYVQINGVTVIVDYSQFNFNLLKQFTPSFGKKFGGVMSESMPARLKSMNVVNEFKIFDIIYAIMKPFTKQKMQKRLRLHGNEYKTLHEVVSAKSLPQLFGGSGPDLNIKAWKKKMMSTAGNDEDTAL